MTQTEQKLFKDMTADEQLKYLTDLTTFAQEKLPLLEQVGDAWEQCHVKSMREGLTLITAFQFARDFVEKSLRYGDYSARVKRVRFYIELIQKKISEGQGLRGAGDVVYALVPPQKQQAARRGRPASAETIARREAEAIAAQQQQTLFEDSDIKQQGTVPPRLDDAGNGAAENIGQAPFIPDTPGREDAEYKLSIAQKRGFLSPDLQRISDNIRALRTSAGAAAEKAKTMAELKASPELIAPVAEEAQRTLEQVNQIYASIDIEMAELWYRLQNGSPEWKTAWMKRYGFRSIDDMHPDLKTDLRKHYKKVTETQPDFEAVMRKRIEEESPEFIAKQKADAEKKKEVQDIIRYFKRKDNAASEARVKTAREKFDRLQILLGKKEAAVYRPLLAKIEDEYREAHPEAAEEKPAKPARSAAKPSKTAAKKTKEQK